MPTTVRRRIRSHVEGFGPVLTALQERQFDLWTVSEAERRAMSPRQEAELVKHQNRAALSDHGLGPTYDPSEKLQQAVTEAHEQYLAMTPEQRRGVLHPRHLDQWLADRRVLTIIAADLDDDEPRPDFLQPKSYRLPDEGPRPQWPTRVELTVAIHLDAPLESVVEGVRNLVGALYGPAARRPRRAGATRPTREKYTDDEVARIIGWYYRLAAGQPFKELAIDLADRATAEHVAAARTKVRRHLAWFRREFGIT